MAEDGERIETEEIEVEGENLLHKVKELVHEGNVRRISIKTEEGRSLIDIPLTVGVVGAVLAPVWAAVGAVAALVANCTISVERETPAVEEEGTEAPE